MIIVPTIRHTGSHFVLHLLGVKGRVNCFTWRTAQQASHNSVVFDHVLPHQRHIYLDLIKRHTTIVPLRHPYLTQKSWQDRNRDLDDMIAMWEVMANDIAPLDPHFLPLDVDNRDDYLHNINRTSGLYLQTDWTPQGERKGNSATRHTDVSPVPEVEALCERIEPFLRSFYG